MLNNTFKTDNFEQTLRERFFLERELNVEPFFRAHCKPNDNNRKILEDLFIKRVLSDPYFSIYVSKEIKDSGFDQRDVLAYVNYVLMEKYLTGSPLLNNSPSKDENIRMEELLKEKHEYQALKHSPFYYNLQNEFQEAIKSLPFNGENIDSRWQEMSLDNWDGVNIIPDPFVGVKSRDNLFMNRLRLLQVNSTLKNLKDITDFRNECRFMFENLESNFRTYHEGEFHFFNAPLFAFLNFNTEFVSRIKSMLEEYGYYYNLNNYEVAKYLKIYTDAILISQFHWFTCQNWDSQLSLLSGYYDDQEITIPSDNINMFSGTTVLHYLVYQSAQSLYNHYGQKDYDEAIKVLSSLNKVTDDVYLKYLCVSQIGDNYQEKNEYLAAANCFTTAYDLSRLPDMVNDNELNFLEGVKRLDRLYRKEINYIQYVELFNIAEMYFSSGNKTRTDELLTQLKEEVGIFSIPKQILIWHKIFASCYHRQDKAASAILKKIITLSDFYTNNKSGYLEEDIEEHIDYSKHATDITRQDCIDKFIDNLRDSAEKHLRDFTCNDSELDSDSFEVNTYLDPEFISRKDKQNVIESILRVNGLTNILRDNESIVPLTSKPGKLLCKVKSAIKQMEKLSPDTTLGERYIFDVIQRLELEQARCYYLLREYHTAQDILNKILESATDDYVLFTSHCMLGIVLARKRRTEESIHHFEMAIDTGFPHKKYIVEHCRDELLSSLDKTSFFRIIDKIINKLDSAQKESLYKDNAFLEAVSTFNQIGLTDEALHFIESGLHEDELTRLKLLEEKAYIHYLDRDLVSTKKLLDDIVDEAFRSENRSDNESEYYGIMASVFHKAAILSAKTFDFVKAEKYIDQAIYNMEKCNDSTENFKIKTYMELKEVYHNLAGNTINYDKIDDPDVRAILETAEMILSYLFEQNGKNIDYSLAFVEYGKAIETALYNKFVKPLRSYIFSKHEQPINDVFFVGEKDYEGEGILDISPKGLAKALSIRDEQTISLGSWKKFIYDEVFCPDSGLIKNPYIIDSYGFLKGCMSESKWYSLVERCAVIAKYRNGSAHYGCKGVDFVSKKRFDTVEKINEIIEIIYGEDSV
jgi:tetratricopeptide (TPR) repeat protein